VDHDGATVTFESLRTAISDLMSMCGLQLFFCCTALVCGYPSPEYPEPYVFTELLHIAHLDIAAPTNSLAPRAKLCPRPIPIARTYSASHSFCFLLISLIIA